MMRKSINEIDEGKDFASKNDALDHLATNYLKTGHTLFVSGISKIRRYYKGLLNDEDIRKFLSSVYTYQKNKEFHRPLRNPVFCRFARSMVQMDLICLTPEIAKENGNHNYIACAIDCFTRKLFCKMLKTKAAKHVVEVVELMIKEMKEGPCGAIPTKVLTDLGLEWRNKKIKELFENYGITLQHNFTSYKASIVERAQVSYLLIQSTSFFINSEFFQRSLQKKIYLYMTAKGSRTFYKDLDDIVLSFNKSHNRSIDCSPLFAEFPQNHFSVRWNLEKKYSKFSKIKSKKKKPRFHLGQVCRVALERTVFKRGYDQSFSDQLYTISSIKDNLPLTMYKIKPISLNSESEPDLLGSFYESELFEVGERTFYPIESIVKKFPRKKTCLVKWKDFPASFNSEIPMADVKSYAELMKS